jgi:hypothetical protein
VTTLYVAGPMTGLPDFNYPAFRAAATELRDAGYVVEDPSANINPTPDDYHGWLRAGLAQLITCDGVALLDGWEASGGARLEVNVAATLGMRVRPVHEWVTEAQADPEREFPDHPERVKCRGCGSFDTHRIGIGSRLIAIDDAIDYENWQCIDCGREWER